MLSRATQCMIPYIFPRYGASFSTTTCLRGLNELIVTPPKETKEGDQVQIYGVWVVHLSQCYASFLLKILKSLIRKMFLRIPDITPWAGRAWKASELRQKSWDDLHKLWWVWLDVMKIMLEYVFLCLCVSYVSWPCRFVLLKEKNKLHSEKLMYKAQKRELPQPRRISKVSAVIYTTSPPADCCPLNSRAELEVWPIQRTQL